MRGIVGRIGVPLLFEDAATSTFMGYSFILLEGIELRRELCVTKMIAGRFGI